MNDHQRGLVTLSLLKANLTKKKPQQQQQQQQQQGDFQTLICEMKLKSITIHLWMRKSLCQRFLYLRLIRLEMIRSNKLARKVPHTQSSHYKTQWIRRVSLSTRGSESAKWKSVTYGIRVWCWILINGKKFRNIPLVRIWRNFRPEHIFI